ncbi:MAG: TolC family outer membrane protein [Magnetovibrio sp.]|nr:TolC family outer membrane protein [Magnetovibrio sp.]
MTYLSNPTLLAAREALRVVIEQHPQAQAKWMPSLSTSGTASDTLSRTKADTRTASKTRELKNAMSLTQTLYRGGRNFAELRKAEAAIKGQRFTYVSAEQTVILSAITAYMDVLRDRRLYKLRKANVELLQKRLDSTQTQFDLRQRTLADLSQAKARLSQAQAILVQAQSTQANAVETYNQIIGRAPQDLSMPDVPTVNTDDLEVFLVQVDKSNPTLLTAEYAVDQTREDIKIQTGARLPTLAFEASMSHSRSKELSAPPASRTRELSGTFTLTVPLYQSGSELSQVRAARYQNNQRLMELDAARRAARQSAIADWNNLQSARASVDAFSQSAQAARVARDSIAQELEVGRRSLIDLLNAEQELANADVSFVQAQRNLIVNSYTFMRTTGELTAASLAVSDDLYDPQTDINKANWNLFTADID